MAQINRYCEIPARVARNAPLLVMTDLPESWSVLVRQIGELEALLADSGQDWDSYAARVAAHLRVTLELKRGRLRALVAQARGSVAPTRVQPVTSRFARPE